MAVPRFSFDNPSKLNHEEMKSVFTDQLSGKLRAIGFLPLDPPLITITDEKAKERFLKSQEYGIGLSNDTETMQASAENFFVALFDDTKASLRKTGKRVQSFDLEVTTCLDPVGKDFKGGDTKPRITDGKLEILLVTLYLI